LTLHRLDSIMNGDIEEIVQTLTLTEQAELLEQENNL
jgi:peptide chain release factor 1